MLPFFQGCMKKGGSGCFAAYGCEGGPRKMPLLPKARRHPGCVCPACRAGPSLQPQGWKQRSTGCPGAFLDPECPGRGVSASADAEYGPFFIKKASVLYFNLTKFGREESKDPSHNHDCIHSLQLTGCSFK